MRAASGATDRLKLSADGTGYHQSGLTGTGGCAVTHGEVGDHRPPQRLHFSYSYEASQDVLTAIDGDCAATHPDSPSSQSLYRKNA